MNFTPTEITTWKRPINSTLTKLSTDLNNHQILADPWRRKAESMSKAWKVLLQYGRRLHPHRTNKQVHNWKAATAGMVTSLCQRAYQKRVRTGWKYWASQRAMEARRWPGKFLSI